MPKNNKSRDKFRFKALDTIGALDAEEDQAFLDSCFKDTGAIDVLRNCADARGVIVGRTGTGKTALLLRLQRIEERVIEVPPESLALAYVSNSTILRFLEELGVKLDIFFKLLWRHVFTVELLKKHFRIQREEDKASFAMKLKNLFKDKKHSRALEYLETWGKSFWEETEYRIREVTTTLEEQLRANVGEQLKSLGIPISAGAARNVKEEQRAEIVQRAQKVVNSVQIRQLSDILELIDSVLEDPQKRYYIVIDRLDEDWIEEALRYRLIRALVETCRDFRRIRNAKIIVALRLDLLDRVFRLTRDPGFQEEKYESMYMSVNWSKEQLKDLLDGACQRL